MTETERMRQQHLCMCMCACVCVDGCGCCCLLFVAFASVSVQLAAEWQLFLCSFVVRSVFFVYLFRQRNRRAEKKTFRGFNNFGKSTKTTVYVWTRKKKRELWKTFARRHDIFVDILGCIKNLTSTLCIRVNKNHSLELIFIVWWKCANCFADASDQMNKPYECECLLKRAQSFVDRFVCEVSKNRWKQIRPSHCWRADDPTKLFTIKSIVIVCCQRNAWTHTHTERKKFKPV